MLDGVFAELGLCDRKLDRVSVKRRLDRYAIERVAAEPWRSFLDMGHACRLQSRATAFGPLQLRREIDVARFEAGRGGVGDVRREHLQPFRTQRSEEHTSELQSLMRISYAVFCLKKKNTTTKGECTNLT